MSEDYTDTSPRIDSYPRRSSNDAAIITSQDQMNRVQRLETESEINILPSGIPSLPYFLLWVSSSCRLAVGVLLRIRNKRVQVIWSGLQLPLSRLADAVVRLVERVRDATVVRRSTGARSVLWPPRGAFVGMELPRGCASRKGHASPNEWAAVMGGIPQKASSIYL